jgi:hypothetical protein
MERFLGKFVVCATPLDERRWSDATIGSAAVASQWCRGNEAVPIAATLWLASLRV